MSYRNYLFILVLLLFGTGCEPGHHGGQGSANGIDLRSYRLGGISAFAEVVDIGIKNMALSAPMLPEECKDLYKEAQRIAEENNVEIYYEEDFLVTDLFPAEITEGKHLLIIYSGNTLKQYQELKEEKRLLMDTGEYESINREEIARRMGALLSYPEERINALLANK